MSEFTSSVSSQTASWFEFLLNPTLLDTFLTEDNLGNGEKWKKICWVIFLYFQEITGTDLIIQFLISANLIEQKTKMKSATENPSMIISIDYLI